MLRLLIMSLIVSMRILCFIVLPIRTFKSLQEMTNLLEAMNNTNAINS